MRVVLALQYLRARRIRETRELTTRYAIGFGFAAAIWIALRPGAGSAAILAVDHSADRRFHRPLAGGETQRELPAHFPERFGLFTIILLGEFVASVMRGIESQKTCSVAAASTAFTSMAFAFALWWWYFEGAKSSAERHVKTKRQAVLFHIYTIALKSGESLHASAGAILCGAVAVLMLALMIIGVTSETVWRKRGLARHLWPQCAILGLPTLFPLCPWWLPCSSVAWGRFRAARQTKPSAPPRLLCKGLREWVGQAVSPAGPISHTFSTWGTSFLAKPSPR